MTSMDAAAEAEARSQHTGTGIKVGLFGAAPDTANMGVSALFHSTVAALERNLPGISITVFDNGLGRRTSNVCVDDGREITIECLGARGGKRLDRPENLSTMSTLSKLGRFGATLNANLRVIDGLDAVPDISGGDSFTDLYGTKRFFSVVHPKLIALRRGVPLILLPQTYGPFRDPELRAIAAKAVRGAAMCWARDESSFEILQGLLGDDFDPDRHRCGVDMAFALRPRECRGELPESVRRLLDADRKSTPLVGFNVSGLIYNDPAAMRSRYGFKADYPAVVKQFLRWLLENTAANVLLIPHVMNEPGHYESDMGACEQLADAFAVDFRERVAVSPLSLDQNQVKWLIGQTDWFCGTRMHSTIAALSSGVPTATVSYSDKAKGVFESCGQGEQVIDPRELDTPAVVKRLQATFETQAAVKTSLDHNLPAIKTKAAEQMEAITEMIRAAAARRGKQVASER